jgi:hypothetical protein
MARVYSSAYGLSRNTTTSTTPQDQVTLTFTPNANKKYALLWGCLLDNSATNNDSLARLYNSTDVASLQEFNFEAQDTTDKFQCPGAAIYTAPGSPSSMTFKVQYYSESSNTTGCQDACLIALELDAADFSSVTAAEQSTSSGTYVDIGPSATVGAGDFLIIAAAEINQSGTSPNNKWQIYDGSAQVTENGAAFLQDTTNYTPWWQIVRVQPGSSTTYSLRFKGGNGQTARSRNTTLIALDLAQFSDVIYGDSLGEDSTNNTTATTKLSVTDTPSAQDYLQLFAASRRHTSTSNSGYTDYTRGGSAISVEAEREPNTVGDFYDHGYGVVSTLTASSTTWEIRYRTEDNTTYIKNAAFVALGLEDVAVSIDGDLAATLAALTLTAAGDFAPLPVTGDVAATLAAVTLAAEASHAAPGFSGDVAATLAALTLAAAGDFTPLPVTGDVATTLAALTLTAAGDFTPLPIGGDTTATLAALSLAAAGEFAPLPVSASLAQTLAALSLSGTATTPLPERAPGFTDAFKAAAFAAETGQVLIVLLTIDHEDLDAPIRLSGDPTIRASDDPVRYKTVSREMDFDFLPFQLVLPDEQDRAAPRCRLTMDNIARELIALLRSTASPPTVDIEIVLSGTPDLVEVAFPRFRMVTASYDDSTVQCDLTLDGLSTEPLGYMSFDPARFPGLFNNSLS